VSAEAISWALNLAPAGTEIVFVTVTTPALMAA
jgi:hypothetical protein